MAADSEINKSKATAHQGWRTLIPFRCVPRDKKKEIPIEHVGLFSFLLYGWLDGFMWRAFRSGIERRHLWSCPEVDSAEINADRLEKAWKDEVKGRGVSGASLPRVLMRLAKKRWLVATLMLIVSFVLLFVSVAYIMMNILQLTTKDDASLWHGLVLVAALFLTSITSQILFIGSVTVASIAAGRLRAGVLCLTFRKLMRVASLQDKTIGKVVNLFSNDGLRIFEGLSMGHMIISGPLLAIGSTAYAIYLIGPWALIGLAVLLLLLPLQMMAGKTLMKFRAQAIVLTDTRVRMMTEYLANIRFIKMYSWEAALIRIVEGARRVEQKILEKANIAMSLLFMTAGILVSIATMCTLIAYTMSGNHLSGAQGFMYLLIYTCIQDKLELCMMSLKLVSEFSVAARRFQEILLLEDSEPGRGSDSYGFCDGHKAFDLCDVAFRWPCTRAELLIDNGLPPSTHGRQQKLNNAKVEKDSNGQMALESPLLSNDEQQETFGQFDLTIGKGQVVGIMGPVSSGKTSLIRALLGQMNIVQGSIRVGGSVAYVPQQPWILNATVRDNILLGSNYNETKYASIVDLCCLTEDLAVLIDGDQTEIGERGVTLSGGQKQRISLARALYSDRDVYLLDDPLASVDPDVADNIFNKVVLSHLLGKTVLLVTHQIKFFRQCDLIIRLNERQLFETGTHEELMRSKSDYSALMTKALSASAPKRTSEQLDKQEIEPSITRLDPPPSPAAGPDQNQPKSENHANNALPRKENTVALMKEEEQAKGSISFGTYLAYMTAAGGIPVALCIVLVSILAEATKAFSFWWLAHWLEQGGGDTMVYDNSTNTTKPSDNISDNPMLWMYNLVYGMSLVAIILLFTLRSVAVVKVLMRASSRLHDKLLHKVMRTSILFFDTTPLGRLINRFSRDMDEMDSKLPMLIENTLKMFLNILIYMGLIAAIMPWFLIAVPIALVVFLLLYVIFRAGVRELHRMQLVAMSPLITHVDGTIRGLASIKAYDKLDDFDTRFHGLVDHSTVTVFLTQFASRWVGIRLSFITTTLVSFTALLIFLLRDEIQTAYCGAAIIYAFQLLTLFQLFVRFAVDAGATFASTERIHKYTKMLKDEGPLVTKTFALPKDWPSKGQIKFSNLNLRYREGLPLVLNGVSFSVKSKEKIGIVGRTGSGKSSLVGALFRLTEATGGLVEIDEIDIALIGLDELRANLSIIPQDPVLFSGTIRTNLDPFNRHIDQEIWHALEKCHIKDLVKEMEGQLSAKVLENGDNLSQGERQLLCMARVLLRHTKIIILDEATASLDNETEERIQQTISETFQEATMLIIAHRMKTALSCDRVLVLDEGKVIEFDEPSTLLAKPDSRLSQLISISSGAGSIESPLEKDPRLVWV